MDETMNTAANAEAVDIAASEGVANPTETVTTEPIAEITPATEPAAEAQPTETQAVAKRIREVAAKAAADAEAAAKQRYNAAVSKLLHDQGVDDIDTLEARLAEQEAAEEAAKQNIPVEAYSRLVESERKAQEALDRLSSYERKESLAKEAEALAANETWGDFYKENKDEIHAVAEASKTTLDIAKLLVLDKKGFQKPNIETIKQQAVQEYLGKLKAGNKPVEGSGATPVVVPSTPKTWEDARKAAMAGLNGQ